MMGGGVDHTGEYITDSQEFYIATGCAIAFSSIMISSQLINGISGNPLLELTFHLVMFVLIVTDKL